MPGYLGIQLVVSGKVIQSGLYAIFSTAFRKIPNIKFVIIYTRFYKNCMDIFFDFDNTSKRSSTILL